LAFHLILQGLKGKIKLSKIYFDEKCDLSADMKTRDCNVLLSFYPYLEDKDNVCTRKETIT
jgi:hypothetical protein